MFISICIATYKRPAGLSRLLEGLNNLRFNEIELPRVEVVIADNDGEGSAKQIYESVKPDFKWELVYGIEPQQGVTFARNRSLALASPDADFLVFIDDDEVPTAYWLESLIACQIQYDADVVTGPVFPKFEAQDVPEWIVKGGFFAPAEHETGKAMEVAFTNNTLVRSADIRQLDNPFDENLAFRGSEDVHLFMNLFKQGSKIIWCNEAVVYEFIPESRLNLKWLRDRNYYGWSTHSLVEKQCFPSLAVQGMRMIKGCLLILIGGLTLVPSFLMGQHRVAKSIIQVYRGLGSLSGLINVQGAWGGADR
ncbi:MAG: glycosyltransferase family 2 protein [Leptolyngbya sp. SIOISBB]|nr:glycosyltransferase family 2 protein [Leptolyngbya sp. SIOISBB]